MDRALIIASFAGAIGAGVMAGFFYSFSNVVMGALGRIAAPAGIAAMQSINRVVLNPLFFTAFFGTAVLSLVLLAAPMLRAEMAGVWLMAAGGGVYLLSNIVVTMMFNVPLNTALAATDPDSAAGAALWADYLRRWTLWNHVRTLGGVAALILFILALMCAS